MNIKRRLLIGIAALVLAFLGTGSLSTSANHSFIYWAHPRWVTVRKASTIVKIKNVYPLYKSYVVKKYRVHRGHHLRIHHVASYTWQVESGHFNSNTRYTYVVARSGFSWFRPGIH